MVSIPLSVSALDSLKKEVRRNFTDRKSSHLTEAIAAALGFKSHAALLTQLEKDKSDPLYYLLDENRFDERMQTLGYPADPEFIFEFAKTSDMINTTCPHAYKIEYNSTRKKAWRNLVVCAVNEALTRRLFSLRPGDNRWSKPDSIKRETHLFDFVLPCDLPARVAIHDAGFHEVTVRIAVNPNGDWVRASNAGFHAGDAVASTWVERLDGAWIQSNFEDLRCRRHLLPMLANMEIATLGYGDRGRIRV